MNLEEAAQAFRAFAEVIKALRTPGTGCPWDLEQTHQTLRPYLVEEAHEVLDAIDRGDDRLLQEELGDLLLQVVLHAQLADDRGAFSITEVVRGITAKMVRRHPHVFGTVQVSGSAEVAHNWEQIKAAEQQASGKTTLADKLARVPESLPALLRAQRLGAKAAQAGFDHGAPADILNDVRQRLTELEAQLGSGADLRGRLEHGLGDLLFALAQLARGLDVSAEDSLRDSARRFVDRFRRIEQPARETDG